jgi:hypothetical protein
MSTISVPEDVLKRAMDVSRDQSPEQVVVRALEEYAKRHDPREVAKVFGTFRDDFTAGDPELPPQQRRAG